MAEAVATKLTANSPIYLTGFLKRGIQSKAKQINAETRGYEGWASRVKHVHIYHDRRLCEIYHLLGRTRGNSSFTAQTGLRFNKVLHLILNYANASVIPRTVTILCNSNPLLHAPKMAAVKPEHNRRVQFSTTLPINGGTPHNLTGQGRRGKVRTSWRASNGRTKMRVPECCGTRFCERGCGIAL